MHHHGHHDHGPGCSHGSGHHQHSYSAETPDDRKRLKSCMWLNGAYGVIQLLVWFLIASMVLFTDAIHNISDMVPFGTSLLAVTLAAREHNSRMTLGLKRGTITATFINYALLYAFMLWAIAEAVMRIVAPEAATGKLVAEVNIFGIGVNPGILIATTATLGIGVNLYSALVLREGKEDDSNIKSVFIHQLTDLIASIGAAIAGVIYWATGMRNIDAFMTIVISLGLLWMVRKSAWNSWLMLNGGTNPTLDTTKVKAFLESLQGVKEVHSLQTPPLSTTESAMHAHVVIDFAGVHQKKLLQVIRQEMYERFGIVDIGVQFEDVDDKSCLHLGHPYGRHDAKMELKRKRHLRLVGSAA